ncbi:MAG: hypothetical protein K0Q79_3750 [Flavipsychrobacter sp.]|nr:hypothetical protein [Flavipsychrobacter sp.]
MVSYPYKTHRIALPGNCEIAYVDEGRGEQTILFIHGLANYAMVWQKNIEHLKHNYRCIAIDLPGNGLSGRNEHDFSIKFFAESVYAFIKAMGLKKLCIAGHSMGGQVAMTLLINHPECAEKLVLCAPAGLEEFSSFDKTLFFAGYHLFDMVSSEEGMLRKTIEHSFYHHGTQAESVIKELTDIMKTYKLNYYRKMIDGCIKGMIEEPVLDRVHLIKQPTLILFGMHDALIPNKLLHHYTPEKMARDAVKKFPSATLEMFANCGHFLQWEKAEEVSESIVMFLKRAGTM